MKKHECQKRKENFQELRNEINNMDVDPEELGAASQEEEDLRWEYSERFCLNSKCSWHGHRTVGKQKLCPSCGYATCFYTGNDGFFMHGPVPKKIYPKPEAPEDYEPYDDQTKEIIRPYNKRYHLPTTEPTWRSEYSHGNPSFLPSNFHYYGMDKVKGGKGYKKDGTPIGVKGHKCEECDGTIISLQMNTSSKGFETTSEKVCDTCGLIYPGSFQILEKKDQSYKSPTYDTHEDWLEKNKPTFDLDDVDMELERWANWNGYRANEEEVKGIGSEEGGYTYVNPRYAKRLKDARGRLDNVPASKHQPMQSWRQKQYHEIADDYIHELGIGKLDAIDIHYYIDKYGINNINRRANKDDIILHLCVYVGKVKYFHNDRRYKKYLIASVERTLSS